jgi:hypothetical protein
MSAGTALSRNKQQNHTKKVASTEVVSIGGYSRVVVTFADGSKLFAYGSDTQTRQI